MRRYWLKHDGRWGLTPKVAFWSPHNSCPYSHTLNTHEHLLKRLPVLPLLQLVFRMPRIFFLVQRKVSGMYDKLEVALESEVIDVVWDIDLKVLGTHKLSTFLFLFQGLSPASLRKWFVILTVTWKICGWHHFHHPTPGFPQSLLVVTPSDRVSQ